MVFLLHAQMTANSLAKLSGYLHNDKSIQLDNLFFFYWVTKVLVCSWHFGYLRNLALEVTTSICCERDVKSLSSPKAFTVGELGSLKVVRRYECRCGWLFYLFGRKWECECDGMRSEIPVNDQIVTLDLCSGVCRTSSSNLPFSGVV